MQKYKIMLIIPFMILVIAAWGNLGSGDKAMEAMLAKQQQLVDEAEEYAGDRIYFRAAEKLEEARKLNVGDVDAIEKKLMECYLADNDTKGWLNICTERILRKASSEDAIIELAEYYGDKRKYDDMLETVGIGLEIYPDSEKLAQVRDSVKYSYSYKKCDFDEAAPSFSEAVAVRRGDEWGFAPAGGGKPDNFIYDSAVSFCGGFAAVRSEGKVFLINSSLKKYSLCHDETVDGVFLFDGTRAVVTAGSKYMLADEEMDIVGDQYDFIGSVSEELYPAKQGDKWLFIGEDGERAVPGDYDGIALNGKYSAFFDGIAFVCENGSYKMIDPKGEYIGGNSFEGAYPFLEKKSLAAVKQNGKWGFADSSGEIVIPCQYECAKSFSQGLAAVMINGSWGYINRKGELLIPPGYDTAEPFEDNCALVYSADSCGYITLDYYS